MTNLSVPRLMPLNAVRTKAWPGSSNGSSLKRISTAPGAVYQMARAVRAGSLGRNELAGEALARGISPAVSLGFSAIVDPFRGVPPFKWAVSSKPQQAQQ
jgi:hypothetical protein